MLLAYFLKIVLNRIECLFYSVQTDRQNISLIEVNNWFTTVLCFHCFCFYCLFSLRTPVCSGRRDARAQLRNNKSCSPRGIPFRRRCSLGIGPKRCPGTPIWTEPLKYVEVSLQSYALTSPFVPGTYRAVGTVRWVSNPLQHMKVSVPSCGSTSPCVPGTYRSVGTVRWISGPLQHMEVSV